MLEQDEETLLDLLQELEYKNQLLQQDLQQKNQELHDVTQKLSMATERLQKAGMAQTVHTAGSVCLKLEHTQEFYAGEVVYFVVEALKSHRLYGSHQRFTQVVEDLSQSNAGVLHPVEQNLHELKTALVGYKGPTPKLEEVLRRFGIELVENNKHLKAKFVQANNLGMVTLGRSASDQKAGMNNFKYFTDKMLPGFK